MFRDMLEIFLILLYDVPRCGKILRIIKFDEFTVDNICIKLNSVNINICLKAIVEMTNPSQIIMHHN